MIHHEKIMEILADWRDRVLSEKIAGDIASFIMAEIPTPQHTQDSEMRDKLAMLYLKKLDKLPNPEDISAVFHAYMRELTEKAYAFADAFIKNIPNE